MLAAGVKASSGGSSSESPGPAAEPSRAADRSDDRTYLLDKPKYQLPEHKAKKTKGTKLLKKQLKKFACALLCNYFWACCCCKALQLEVRGLLLLTTVETIAAFSYGSNLLATALTSEADVDTAIYYIATLLITISIMLWSFVISAIRRENVYELIAANLLSCMLCATPLLLAVSPSDRLDTIEVEFFNTSVAEVGAAQRTAAAALEKSVEVRRALFVTGAVLSGVAFIIMSMGVRREFGWRLFLLYGTDELKRKLYPKLMLFWALWKVDMMWGALCLVATWAFLYDEDEEWEASERFGIAAAVLSNAGCNVAVAICVAIERRFLTLCAILIGCIWPTYLIYTMQDVFRQVLVDETEKYEDVWLAALMPTLTSSALSRLMLLASTFHLVVRVFGRGMKGKDPYVREIHLPVQIEARLAGQPRLISILKALVKGQLIEVSLQHEVSAVEVPLAPKKLQSRFMQLSSDLSTLRWSWKDYVLIDQILDMGKCQPPPKPPPKRSGSSMQMMIPAGDAPAAAATADGQPPPETDNYRARFWVLYRDRGRRMRMQVQLEDPAAMEVWFQGMRTVYQLNPNPFPGTNQKQWLIDVFQAADKDGSGIVDRNEVPLLLSAANKTVRREWINQVLADDDDGALNFVEVERVMMLLLRDNEHVTSLFKQYARGWRKLIGAQEHMSVDEWVAFQRAEQGETDEAAMHALFGRLLEAAAPPTPVLTRTPRGRRTVRTGYT